MTDLHATDADLRQATVDVKNVSEHPIEAAATIIEQAGAMAQTYLLLRAMVRRGGEQRFTQEQLLDTKGGELDVVWNRETNDVVLRLIGG